MKGLLVLGMVVALASAAPSFAAKGDFRVGLQLGGTTPTGDFGDVVRTGFMGGLQLDYMEADHRAVGLDVVYHAWGTSPRMVSGFLDYLAPGWNYRLHAVQTTAHVLVELPALEGAPYLRFGGGLYWLRTRLELPPSGHLDDTEYDLGYNAGAGARLDLGRGASLGVEGTGHAILLDGKNWRGVFTSGLTLRW